MRSKCVTLVYMFFDHENAGGHWHHYSVRKEELQQNHGLDPLPAKFCSIEIILDVHQGARSSKCHPILAEPIELQLAEGYCHCYLLFSYFVLNYP